ncbi:hypothetical protein GCM10009836_41730 [Pseudonocardia ailaonensis]|uniref:DUF2029 domain-containing protein n=1 Tax=Pseudonocardia ailaonensis TaxID=367279 RepID=A0ABN2N856_9PSEU
MTTGPGPPAPDPPADGPGARRGTEEHRTEQLSSAIGARGRHGAAGTRQRLGRGALALLVLLTGLILVLGYANKARCTGPEFDAAGRSQPDFAGRAYGDVCYSDIQKLWLGRDVDQHVFPYLNGSMGADGELHGGSVEYPVLTGVLIWLGALAAHTDAGFLLGSALLLAPFGLVTGWLLGRLARWRALLWALGPPLVLYAFHNWDLPAVACSVGAVFAVHGTRRPRPVLAAVLLGLGCALKLYPGAFLVPLALLVLTRGAPPGGTLDVPGALRVLWAGLGTVVLVNLPFALVGYEGWRASFTFQERRPVDASTNSIWFWGVRPLMADLGAGERFGDLVDVLSPLLVLLSFAAAALYGLRRWRRGEVYPWVGVSGAMLCGFLLLHKVHSPQYTLWLLPFLVLLRVRGGWIAGYLVADALIGIGVFRWFHVGGGVADGFAPQAVVLGVWGTSLLCAILFVLFLRVPTVAGLDAPVDLSARRTPAARGGPPGSDDRAATPRGPGRSPHPSGRARGGRTAAPG